MAIEEEGIFEVVDETLLSKWMHRLDEITRCGPSAIWPIGQQLAVQQDVTQLEEMGNG